MSKNSKIAWTDDTWNPWHGCHKVSSGCRFCYMYRDKGKYGQTPKIVSKSKTKFYEPLKWKDDRLIFTCSWSDWFIDEADEWRPEAWEVIRQTPRHTYQILTKRPERIKGNLPDFYDEIADRVWMGVSIESQDYVGRIDYLLDLPCIKFVSFEPLLEEINWTENMNDLNWIIIGGESGNDNGDHLYRPMKIEWMEKLVDDARHHNIPIFIKQMGTYQAKLMGLKDRHGRDINEFPLHLQIQEYPVFKKGLKIERPTVKGLNV